MTFYDQVTTFVTTRKTPWKMFLDNGEDLLMTLMTIGEDLLTTLTSTGEDLLTTRDNDTDDHCDNNVL